jgi:hypothetical protein
MRPRHLAPLALAFTLVAAGPCLAQATTPPAGADAATTDTTLQPDQSAPGNAIRFSGSNRTGVGDCTARNTILRGNGNAITFRGGCRSLTVTGSKNDVTVEIAAGGLISVQGNNNEVHWRVTGGMRPPRLKQSGHNNTFKAEA